MKPAKTNMGKVEGLTTNMKYEFRVRAENRAGRSGPSDTTLPHMVKSQKDPPMICRKAMEEKTIKVALVTELCRCISPPNPGEPAAGPVGARGGGAGQGRPAGAGFPHRQLHLQGSRMVANH